MTVNSYLAALSIVQIALLGQFPFLSKSSQPDVKQQITMRAKPAVVRIISGCGGEYYSYLTSERISFVYDPKKQGLKGPITGSGYFVNSDGYIITNAHMVESVVDSEQKCKEILKRNLREKLGVTEQKLSALISSGQIEFLTDSFFYYRQVVLPNANAEGAAEVLPFEVKKVGTSANEGSKDVAVIKVEVKDAPVLDLAVSGDLQVQDPIIVIGYPGAADPDFLSKQSQVEATVTEGIVSNPNKKLQDGSPIIQVDVLVAPGSSGSPVLDRDGKVVGMVALRGVDEGSTIPFAVPTSTIMEFIRDAGIDNRKGKTDLMYQEGLKLFWQGDFEGAKTKFDAVQSLFPQHSEANRLIRESEQQIATSWANKTSIPLLAGAGIAVIGLLGAYFVVRRRSTPSFAGGSAAEQEFVRRAAEAMERQQGSATQAETSQNRTMMSPPPRGKDTVLAITRAVLELKNAEGQVQRFELKANQHQLGRDRTWADLKVPETGWDVLSKRHATLKREGNSYRIYDGDGFSASTNGVLVNGTRVTSGGCLLNRGDQIQIGEDYQQVTGLFQAEDGQSTVPQPGSNSSYRDGHG